MSAGSTPSVHVLAGTRAASAYTETFRMRAREMGGVNVRTRDIIEADAQLVADAARMQTYLDAGYKPCSAIVPAWYQDENQFMPEECDRLVTPGYTLCPSCELAGKPVAPYRGPRTVTA